MSFATRKRVWKTVEVVDQQDGFGVTLDGRRVNTPNKTPLLVPRREMAEAIAAEWDAQGETIDPLSMPFTRSANSAIEKVAHQHHDVATMLAAYGDTDLVCYRADRPEALVQRQAEAWDPALDWAGSRFGARLEPRSGVMHAPQDPTALKRLTAPVMEMTAFQLTGFHDLVSLSGSLVLGLAAAEGWREPDAIWQMSRIDESWQEEQWGTDEEAFEAAEIKRLAFLHAKRFFDLS